MTIHIIGVDSLVPPTKVNKSPFEELRLAIESYIDDQKNSPVAIFHSEFYIWPKKCQHRKIGRGQL